VVPQNPNEAIIRWAADVNPNQCVDVNISGTQVQVLITRLAGALQARVTPIQCQNNPYDANWQKVTLQFEDNGGDANNFLRVEGYLFCSKNHSPSQRRLSTPWTGRLTAAASRACSGM
jgi:hypothetical protein